MSDVLNCDNMTARQARAALRAHCRAQEAARKTERDKRAEHRRANAERLGWVVGIPRRDRKNSRCGWGSVPRSVSTGGGHLSPDGKMRLSASIQGTRSSG